MRSLIAKLTAICITATVFAATPAQASHESPLYRAASEYREAVRHFERSVIRSRYLHRQHERVVDDLEDATSRLRSAARHPERTSRLFQSWDKIIYLHRRAEAVVFADPTCPSGRELAECWYAVQITFDHVAHELAGCGWRSPHQHQPIYVETPIYVPPQNVPPLAVPQSVSNHPSQWNPNRGQPATPSWAQQSPTNFRSHKTGIYQTLTRQPPRAVQAGAKLQRLSR